MTSASGRLHAGVPRTVEAAGGLIWLAAIAAVVAIQTDDVDSLAILAIGAGALLGTIGLAGQRWRSLGRLGRTGAVIAALGAVVIAPGEWPWVLLGIMAVPVGTLMVAIGMLRGSDRRPAVALALLAGSIGAASILGGPSWLVAAFGLSHLLAAVIGSGPQREPAGRPPWPALAGAAAAALAVVLISGAVASGELRLPAGVTASVRAGPLPRLAVVIDTDMHPDDWLALLYLASEPNIDIRAVTVDGGSVVGCEAGVGIARDLLADVGQGDVPVACGPAPPPGGIPLPADWAREFIRIAAGIGWTADDGDPPGAPADGRDAVALLRAAVDAEPITIISLGPPTNVARLLDDPAWDRRNVIRIVQMAGAVDVPGNVESLPSVEFNAAVDPGALATVLASGIEVVLVSLDGTNHVPIRIADIDRMTADRSTRAADLAARVFDSQRDFARSGGSYAWDVLAAIAARQPDIVRTEPITVRVATDPGQAGRTVRDTAGNRILVTVDADRRGFERILLDALLGRAK